MSPLDHQYGIFVRNEMNAALQTSSGILLNTSNIHGTKP